MSWNLRLLLLCHWCQPQARHYMLNTQPRDSRTPSSMYLTQSHAKTFLPLQTDQIWRKKNQNIGVRRQNMTLVTQLFLSLQSFPDADRGDFFCYENQREPPSLADHGTLRTGVKSHVIDCISAPTGHTIPSNQVTVVLLDMAAVVHMIWPTNAQTFSEYVTKHIIPYMKSHTTPMISRLDAIWDCYPCDSLKTLAHKRHGCGPRTKVEDGSTHIAGGGWGWGVVGGCSNDSHDCTLRTTCK